MSIVLDWIRDKIQKKSKEILESFDPKVFYPSEVGQCLRKLFLKRVNLDKNGFVQFKEATAQQFILGEGLHKYIQYELKNFVKDREIEIEKDVFYRFLDIEIHGMIDVVNHTDKEVIEIKTTSRFNHLENLEKIYRRQLNLYLHQYPNYVGYIFIIDRVKGNYKEIQVIYDPDLFLNDIELFRKVLKAWNFYEQNNKDLRAMYKMVFELPASSNAFECRNCPFYEVCIISSFEH